jgi:excisionase family DNA binding protein
MHSVDPLAVSVEDAAKRAGLGRTEIYRAIKSGNLKSLKIGKRRRIRVDALREWLISHEQKSA